MRSIEFNAMRVIGVLILVVMAPRFALTQSLVQPVVADSQLQVSRVKILYERLSQLKLQGNQPGSTSQTPSGAAKPVDDYIFPTTHTRFNRYVKSTVGPFGLLRTAASSGIDQWTDTPEEWKQGAKGYGKRFASNFGKNVIRQTTQYGLSEAMRLDTGFEKSKRKGFWPRVEDSLVQNVTSRTRRGKRVVSIPIIAGAYAGSIVAAETWYPDRFSYKDGLRWGTYSLAAGFGINLIREFIFKW